MQTLIYDGSYTGLLTAVFEVYEYKTGDVTILPEWQRQDSLFGDTRVVATDDVKARRVWQELARHISREALMDIYRTYLSEQHNMEDMLLEYMRYVFTHGNIAQDYSHRAVLYVADAAKKVRREKHRMEAFVRFRQTGDNLYYATVEPDCNVLPLIADHFEQRYADQQWMIYDMRRKYGIYYDLDKVSTVEIKLSHVVGAAAAQGMLHETEEEYERLWKNYFRSVNIASRRNMKLHRQHMPLRYWKYLTEKQ